MGLESRPQDLSGGFLFHTGCIWDNGHLYREDQPSPAPGLRCLNWLAAQGSRESLAERSECPPGRRAGLVGGGRGP